MSLRDIHSKLDGFQSLQGGVDSGRSPSLLPRTQLVWTVNLTTRNGLLTCRPGIIHRTTPETSGRFQRARGYLADDGSVSIIAVIGGQVYKIDVDDPTYPTQNLSSSSGVTLRSDLPFAWLRQAENFMLINSGEESPLIFDGALLRRANSKGSGGDELPPGEALTYSQGRIWMALPGGRSFIAGDLAYSVTNTRSDILKVTENDVLNGGGSFTVPSQAGTIRSIDSVAIQDSVTGQGPTQVMTTRGSFSVNAPFNREDWASVTNPIQTISLLQNGSTGPDTVVNVNGDLWFRSPDGIRSFVVARRDHGTWVNTPLSREVARALDYDSPELLKFGSSVIFDNRLLTTTQPRQVVTSNTLRGIAHLGLVPLDFNPVSSMFTRSQPQWEGVWTGLRILQILTVDSEPQRCFIFALNDSDDTELWELTTSARFDTAVEGNDVRIQWAFETPEYGFDTGGWNLRQLAYADGWLRRLAGTLDLTFKYRPDADPRWQSWTTAQFCAPYQECLTDPCDTPAQLAEQYRARFFLPAPVEAVDDSTGKPYYHGYRFAVRCEGTGFAQLNQFRLISRDLPEQVEGAEPPQSCTSVSVEQDCTVNDYSYSIVP